MRVPVINSININANPAPLIEYSLTSVIKDIINNILVMIEKGLSLSTSLPRGSHGTPNARIALSDCTLTASPSSFPALTAALPCRRTGLDFFGRMSWECTMSFSGRGQSLSRFLNVVSRRRAGSEQDHDKDHYPFTLMVS